jgi:hypothetical protein
MTDTPKEIWCSTGLYWDYKDDWSEGSWRDNDNCAGVKYVRADRIEELEAQIEEQHNGVTAAHFQGYMEGKQQTEAKLEKVVEALKNLADCVDEGCFCSEMQLASAMDEARTTLAAVSETHKLTGGKDG